MLDLCAAPGAKLSYIYDLLATSARPFTLTAVDVHLGRLSACRNVAWKYHLQGVRLCLCDGTRFNLPPPTAPASPPSARSTYAILDLTKPCPTLHLTKRQKRAHRRHQPRHPSHPLSCPPTPSHPSQPTLYHRILIDAECSHDASIRHIRNFARWGWDTFERRFLSQGRLEGLEALQRGLIGRGWELLEEGGVLVYSVCSGLREQGEDVVEWLWEREGGQAGGLRLCPVFVEGEAEEVSEEEEQRRRLQLEQGGGAGDGVEGEGGAVSTSRWRWKRARPFLRAAVRQEGVRMDPVISGTSGLFIAKLMKVQRAAVQGSVTTVSEVKRGEG